ncbi:uncharacterized protein K441DRAFT_663715 [Cenococcum geophilum 1.58]|uniref:uncharacterized protein n=1 Tax=Cenococcum geophilum 1.58 TaxID=794803 RepID=UPI00358E71D5|nr:hypothetical protein K441DRAFT_663715 [Cenococcum geophilum 1.58]
MLPGCLRVAFCTRQSRENRPKITTHCSCQIHTYAETDSEFCEGRARPGSQFNPSITRIAKGTPIPKTLILIYEHSARFSLQPADKMTISQLYQKLDNFYAQVAEWTDVEQWPDCNGYADARDDFDIDMWMEE